jgi:hypothetical protein
MARSQEKKADWKAGAAKVNITPRHFMWLSGYGARTKPAEGKHTELWAKALALQAPGGEPHLLLTMDLVGIPRELADAVCKRLHEKQGIRRRSVILSVSHTHSAPVIKGNLAAMYFLDAQEQQLVADYYNELRDKLIRVASDALDNMKPARLGWAIGKADFAVNRRNNKEKDIVELKAAGQLKGPVDHDVPVLAVRDSAGKLRAVVCGYACHATVLSSYVWSGDYPGVAQRVLEDRHPGAVALFWAGCGGDQNPLPRRSIALAEKYGQELADAVDAVLARSLRPIRGKIRSVFREIDLPFGELPTREQLVRDTQAKDKYVANRAKVLLKQLENIVRLPGAYPYPVQTWQLGKDLTWVVLGGEVVVDYALRLKKEIGRGKTWVMGYANDVMAYIPSLRVLKEGGYEGGGAMVYYGLPAPWGPQVEEMIVDAVRREVEALQQR